MQENYKDYNINIIEDKGLRRGNKVYVDRLILMPKLDGVSGGLPAPTALYSGKGYPVPSEQDAPVGAQTIWTLWRKEKPAVPAGHQTTIPHTFRLWPTLLSGAGGECSLTFRHGASSI